MAIEYLYIENYKHIHQQEYNFTGKYHISYNRTEGILTIEDNEDFIPNFYGEYISTITGVIGENGAGKSTLLDFIVGEVTTGKKRPWSSEFILITTDKKIWHHPNLSVASLDGWEVQEFISSYNNEDDRPLYSSEFFYYQNIFDGKLKEHQRYNTNNDITFIDLSTNKRHVLYRNLSEEYKEGALVGDFYIRELDSIIKFVLGWTKSQHEGREKLPVRIPKYIKITPSDYIDAEYLLSTTSSSGSNIISVDDRYYIEEIYKYLKNKGTFKHTLVLSIMFGLFNQTPKISMFGGGKYKEILEVLLADDLSNPQKIIENITHYGSIDLAVLVDLITNLLNTDDIFAGDETLVLEINVQNEEIINKILYHVEIIFIQFSMHVFLDFGYEQDSSESGLSSGEKAWLTLYSRLWLFRNEIGTHGNKDLVFLLDEPEMAFHPNWQKRQISEHIKFIPAIFRWLG